MHVKVVDVIVPIYNAYDDLKLCLNSVLEFFCAQARLILIDDCSTDSRISSLLKEVSDKAEFPVILLKNEKNLGFVKTVNKGINFSDTNDVIILNTDTIVTKNWISKLISVAYSNENIATVTPLSNNATICSVPEFDRINDIPEGLTIDEFADLIESISLKLYPEIPTGVGFCMYIKRNSINILGAFDETYGRGYNEENDFCMRAISHCMSNVLADDTFIYHKGGASFQDEQKKLDQVNHQLLLRRYPFYLDLVSHFQASRPLEIWENIKYHLTPLKICLDGRCLTGAITGTQRYTIEILKNLMLTSNREKFYLLIQDGTQKHVRQVLQDFTFIPTLIEESKLESEVSDYEWDIFHRTYQVYNATELEVIKKYTKRFILTYQDLILYKNPVYFHNSTDWFNYGNLSKKTVKFADGVIAISHHAKSHIISEFKISDNERIEVIYHGIDYQKFTIDADAANSEKSVLWQNYNFKPGYLLFIGTDFFHKNLIGTVKLYEKLVESREIDSHLVIAGPSVHTGGSIIQVKNYVSSKCLLKDKVHFLGAVSDDELVQLYRHAGVLLYLTTHEGFGLPPLEAFACGCPVVASNLTSVPEVVGYGAKCFHSGDFVALQTEIVNILTDKNYREYRIQQGFERIRDFSWDVTAIKTLQFYRKILALPPNIDYESQLNEELKRLQSKIQQSIDYETQINEELKRLQCRIQQTEAAAECTIAELQTNNQKFQSRIQETETTIAAMETSKFWKLRKQWFKLKKVLKLEPTV